MKMHVESLLGHRFSVANTRCSQFTDCVLMWTRSHNDFVKTSFKIQTTTLKNTVLITVRHDVILELDFADAILITKIVKLKSKI